MAPVEILPSPISMAVLIPSGLPESGTEFNASEFVDSVVTSAVYPEATHGTTRSDTPSGKRTRDVCTNSEVSPRTANSRMSGVEVEPVLKINQTETEEASSNAVKLQVTKVVPLKKRSTTTRLVASVARTRISTGNVLRASGVSPAHGTLMTEKKSRKERERCAPQPQLRTQLA